MHDFDRQFFPARMMSELSFQYVFLADKDYLNGQVMSRQAILLNGLRHSRLSICLTQFLKSLRRVVALGRIKHYVKSGAAGWA